MRIKRILVSQPSPDNGKSPYFELAEKNNLQIDFRPFIHVEGIPAREFRQDRIDILEHTAVIFTSKTSADHFFRICEELRINVPDSMKYFCVSESTAYYLQKYVVYRKRKIFHGRQSIHDLMDVIKKHSGENFLLPCSDIHKQSIPQLLEDNGISFSKAILYKTVCSDLSDLKDVNYDVLVFFSPSGIESYLTQNKAGDEVAFCIGSTTATEAKNHFKNVVEAKTPSTESVLAAVNNYFST